jgi:enolase
MIALDGTPPRAAWCQSLLGVSMATARAAALAARTALYAHLAALAGTTAGNAPSSCPCRMMNILNGGAHERQQRGPRIHR